MEVVGRTADAAADWIVPELDRFRNIEKEHEREWSKVPAREKSQMGETYMKRMTSGWAKELQTEYVQKRSKL
jgi:hypothetical protein